MLKWQKGSKGQAVVEYILMLAVIMSIMSSLLSFIKVRYLGDPKKCESTGNSKLIICKIMAYIAPNGMGQKKFQYYPFKK